MPIGLGKFDQDRWQLFHTDEDRSEAHDLADQHPEKVKELNDLWLEEAKKYDVLPLNDLAIFEFRALEYEMPGARERAVHLLPGHDRGPGGVGGEHDQRLVQDPRRGRVHARTRRA